ncbi:MAG: hypothetical protein Q7S02_03650 [bacterium]|nr:hypothetical protein [bacterium]
MSVPRPSSASSQLPTARTALAEVLLPLAPILVLAIIAAGYAFVLRPRFAALRDLRARALIEQEVVDLERQTTELANARKTFEEVLATKREIIDAAVPGGEDVPGLFVTLDAAAQHAGLLITSMEVTREEAPVSLPALRGNPVLLMGVAIRNVDYPKLKSFLNLLAASRRLIDVLSVQFSPQSLSTTIRLRTYTLD